LLAAANRNLGQALAILGVVSLLVFAGAWVLVDWGIRRQAARILAAVARFSGGDFGARIGKPYPRGEIGGLMSLDHAFGLMQGARERIERLTRVYAVLSGINSLIVRVRGRDELFKEACRVAVEDGGFRMAWIGIVDRTNMSVITVASAGTTQDFLALVKQRFSLREDTPLGNILSARRSGKKAFSRWRTIPILCQKNTKRGSRSMAVLTAGFEQCNSSALYSGEIGSS
jgi:hypothetical protein